MANNPKFYKPSGIGDVEAMLVSDDTAEDAAIWCGGAVGAEVKPGNPEAVSRHILVPTLGGVIRAWFGQYLVRDYRGRYTSMPADVFEKQFTESGVAAKSSVDFVSEGK